MIRAVLLAAAALVAASCATAPPSASRSVPSNAAIDAQARLLMAREDVKGMAIAVIDNGQVVHVAAYGYRNVEQNLPLQTDTIMYGASVTKAAFAYMVMQLVDEGRLDLDRSIAEYLPRPLPEYEDYADLAGDERWRLLTPRIILNHTTGLANMRWLEEDGKLRLHWTPGERYGYSNEGFWVLQTVLEEGLGLDVGAEMQRRVFDRFGMTRTSMQWRDVRRCTIHRTGCASSIAQWSQMKTRVASCTCVRRPQTSRRRSSGASCCAPRVPRLRARLSCTRKRAAWRRRPSIACSARSIFPSSKSPT